MPLSYRENRLQHVGRVTAWFAPCLLLLLPSLGVLAGDGQTVPKKAAAPLDFGRDVRPILSANCFACHGQDSEARKAGLRLDLAEGAFAVNEDGRQAVKPGDPGQSEAWRRLTTSDEGEVMPPPESHKSVNPDERGLIRRWIEAGAPYQKPWAFEPPAKVPPPDPGGGPGVGRMPIDAFIGARLAREGMGFSPEADRPTLIRRATLALTGLPPTPGELDAALSDPSIEWYEKLVDRLLASPPYGEQMARHWLDVARYGDTPTA